MTDEHNIIPPAEIDELDLEHILAEFSQDAGDILPEPEAPRDSETATASEQPEFSPEPEEVPQREASRNPARVVLTVLAVLSLLTAAAAGIIALRWHQEEKAASAEQKSVEVFSLLFGNPDWNLLHTMAGIQDTPFEGQESFARYMTGVLGSGRLYYMETAPDFAGQCKYQIVCGERVIGTFSMVNDNGIWKLGSVNLVTPRTHSVVITKDPDSVAYVNGVRLDESYRIRYTETLAEDSLPQGCHGYRMEQMMVSDLLTEPQITVVDASGAPVDMIFDEQTQSYVPLRPVSQPEISEPNMQLALNAAQACAAFAIRGNTTADLRQFFDPDSAAYQAVCDTPALLEGCDHYSFDESATRVTNYREYGTEAFSVTITLKLDAAQANGDAQSFDFTWHFLLTRNYAGAFMISEISEQSFHTTRQQVRLTAILDGEVLETKMLSSDTAVIKMPRVTTPDGMEFAGWAERIVHEDGTQTMAILFAPNAGGMVFLPNGTELEPMTLHAVFRAK